MVDDKFINPYNFIQPDKNVFRKKFIDFTKFYSGYYSGQVAISIKSVEDIPIFIPDSEQKRYWIILDDNIEFKGVDPNKDLDKEYYFKIEDRKLERRDNLPEIKPLNDYVNSSDLLQALKERVKWIKGEIKEIYNDAEKKNKKYCIETDDPGIYQKKTHKIMEFCKDPEGNPILPSTTIKGQIHNLIEILSNSCLTFYDKKQIYYRLNPDSGRREISYLSNNTYMVKNLDPADGTAEVIKLDSVKVNTSFFIEDELQKDNPVWAAVVFDEHNKPKYIKKISNESAIESCVEGLTKYFTAKSIAITSKNILIEKPTNFSYRATFLINGITVKEEYFEPRLKDIQPPFLYYARVQKKMVGPRENFEKYYLKEININKENLGKCNNDERIVQCKLKKSGEIETKTQDTLFFKYGEQDLLKFVNRAPSKKIEKKIIEEYNEVLKQRKINLREKDKDEPESLKQGDLIFYNEREDYISYTQIPRKKYSNSIEDIIKRDDKIPKICIDINKLCPVCNMLGSTELINGNKNIAISGKISVGTGRLVNSTVGLEKDIPLKILASPKPSCTYFYLLNGDYNSDNSKIRGRKLYYHHSINNLKYQRGPGDSKDDILIDNQNVSIEALKNFEFKSTIDFINLSEYELGLLLFALNLINRERQKVYHKLGMGKPLGLGTIELKIDEAKSFLIDRKKRYSNFLAQNGEIETGRQSLNKEDFISIFKTKQLEIYNQSRPKEEIKSNFYEIPYISDLFNILEVNSVTGNYPKIKYPRKKTDKTNNEPRGFQWFEDELPSQELPLPSKVKDKSQTLNNWS
jgi:CRISPR-associated protein (TIGR03986 family)